MAKVNVNSATREDLVNVVGLRPEIADAVLGFRRKHHKITDPQALEALPGVGPATLEQLRRALDFGDKGGDGGQAEAGERAVRRAISAARGGAEATRHAAEDARAAEAAAREGTEIVRTIFSAAAETEREVAGWSAEGTAELGRLWVELLGEQTRHNVEVAAALTRAVRWDEVARAQGEFVRASLERLHELNRRYLEIVRDMTEVPSAAAERVGKAA
jgi:Helix-hairpin-helix motif/Phasin protein